MGLIGLSMDRTPDRINGFRLLETEGNFTVEADVVAMGQDLLVIVQGGRSHIGAIGVGLPRQGLKDPGTISATSSVFTFLGHKEDGLVKSMSERLAAHFNRKVVVIAGIHWDDLKAEEIVSIVELCERVTGKIIIWGEDT